jgi:hypothetical protein
MSKVSIKFCVIIFTLIREIWMCDIGWTIDLLSSVQSLSAADRNQIYEVFILQDYKKRLKKYLTNVFIFFYISPCDLSHLGFFEVKTQNSM